MSADNNQHTPLPTPESLKDRVLLPKHDIETQTQETFRLITYNVLAVCHAQRDYASYDQQEHIDADFRHVQIINELEYLDGDIVCLQEVSPDFYDGKLKDSFNRRGFECHFLKRLDESYDEGCATFYRSDKFSCENVELVDLGKVTKDLFNHVMLDDEMETSIAERYAMDQVAIVTELKRTGTDHVIVVANTHICFGNFMKPDLQILQISCLKWILNQKFADSPAIMCGDFNMSPGSPQYIFTTEDILSDAQWNILREKAEIKAGLTDVLEEVVSQSQGKLQFRSIYKHLKGTEPEVTCVDTVFRHCLDYVFYREQSTNTDTDNHIFPTEDENKTVRSTLSPVQVLDTLPLQHVLKDVPPSDVYSSDHFPLFVKFVIEP